MLNKAVFQIAFSFIPDIDRHSRNCVTTEFATPFFIKNVSIYF